MHRSIHPEEAQEIVRIAMARRDPTLGDGPTIEGLAHALGITDREVERLLAEVRGRENRTQRRTFGDRSAVISAALVLALVLVTGTIGGGLMLLRSHAHANTGTRIVSDDGSSVEIRDGGVIVRSSDSENASATYPATATPAMPGVSSERAASE